MRNAISETHRENISLTRPKYRVDIDGLRAIAVLSIVCFHAFPDKIKGGFIGVDIFFVISGYLISTIIYENLERNSFSFAEFYSRRVRRIFPASILILIACFAIGWFVLLADEYKQLGKHVASGASFVSNITIWNERGYFDNAAVTKPLLHLWSLGIEVQFYIVWPLVIWFFWKKKVNPLLITAVAGAVSFAFNIWHVKTNAVEAFFSPQTRFWELLIGGCLAYFTLYKKRAFTTFTTGNNNLKSLFGAAALALGFLLITPESAFPGWLALLPTVGAALIISAGPRAWINRVILSSRVLVWFGLISFPLYLWHWPLLSFMRITNMDILTKETRAAILVVSTLLAWMTYMSVEKPVRFGGNNNVKVCVLLILMIITGSIGLCSYATNRFGGSYGLRSDDKTAFLEHFENTFPEWKYFRNNGLFKKYRQDCNFYDMQKLLAGKETSITRNNIDRTCYETTPGNKHALFIWGDSHAQHLYYGLRKNLGKDWDVLIVASSDCGANAEVNGPSKTDVCLTSNWFAFQSIKNVKPDVVIVAQESGHQFEVLKRIDTKLKNNGIKKVMFTGPSPQWNSELPKVIVRRLWPITPERTFVGINRRVFYENNKLREKFSREKGMIFVDLMGFFCDQSGCLTRIGNDRRDGITSYDLSHLTPVASDYLAKNLLVKIVVNNVKTGKQGDNQGLAIQRSVSADSF